MFQSKSFLSVDIGAGSLKVVEIEPTELGALRLRQFDIRSLGMEGALESKREAATKRELQAALSESGFTSKLINVCAPGFHVFSKFVRLPAVDNSKISQIIQYEAQQNVPFPLNEVVWDYQILGSSPSGELEVLLVAIKTDIVEGLFGIAENSGLKVNLVDVSPAALCNAFRYNYPELAAPCFWTLELRQARCFSLKKEKFTPEQLTSAQTPLPRNLPLKLNYLLLKLRSSSWKAGW